MSFLFRYLRFHDIIGGIHVPVDDGVDKLNRKYTLLVFLFLALPIFTKQYIGDPIECFAPVYFAEHQSRYINSYCWTQSTYYMVPVGDPEDDGDQQEPPDRIMPDEVDYFIGFETVTHIGNERLRRVRVSYYQWAPLILLMQGLCFYIPFLIWNSCANNAGVKLRRLLKKASDIASLPPGCQQREALLAEFVDQFHTLVTGEAGWCADLQCDLATGGAGANQSTNSGANSNVSSLTSSGSQQSGNPNQQGRGGGQRGGPGANDADTRQTGNRNYQRGEQPQSSCCFMSIPIIGSLLACCLKPCSSFDLMGPSKYLCLLYLAVKFAYVFNVGLQFFLLGQFLGRGYLKHGLELINRLLLNGDWWASPRFPLSTLCQVRADMSGGLRSYTCQCVLPINVFNEKIFSVVWFYMAFLMPLNVLSLLFWIYKTFESNRLSYIRLCLWRTRLVELNQIHRTVRKLSQSYLGWDGVFLLRLIEHNHGSIMATLIMSRLWEFYANQMKLQEDANLLAMANNAQNTLSNTTTAISNQLAAAAAIGGGHPQLTAGNPGNMGGGQHGPHQHHGLHQHPQPPNQQQQHGHHGHHHGPHHPAMPPHPYVGHNPPGGGGPNGRPPHNPHQAQFQAQMIHPVQQQQQQAGSQQPHHVSGQISSQPGHHPLNAANTHQFGPQATAASNANLLAQLQLQKQQQQQQQQQQQHHHPLQAQQGVPNQQVGPASGNVAAAVAALAAAAAAANSASQASATAAGQAAANASGASQASSAAQLAASGAGAGKQLLGGASAIQSASSAANKAVGSTVASQQQQQQAAGAVGSVLAGGPPLPPPPPARVVAAVAAAAVAAANQLQQQAANSSNSTSLNGGNGGNSLALSDLSGPKLATSAGLSQVTNNTGAGNNGAPSLSAASRLQQQQQPLPPAHANLSSLTNKSSISAKNSTNKR